MKATTADFAIVGGRMREARRALKLNQVEFYDKFVGDDRIKLRTYQRAETGSNEAGIMLIESFIRAGINANWLLTGEGTMLLADLRPPVAAGLDLARFRLAFEAAEEGLAAAGRVMAPDKKAELVLAVYDLLAEPANTKERILKLVKLAA